MPFRVVWSVTLNPPLTSRVALGLLVPMPTLAPTTSRRPWGGHCGDGRPSRCRLPGRDCLETGYTRVCNKAIYLRINDWMLFIQRRTGKPLHSTKVLVLRARARIKFTYDLSGVG